jgi:NAD(P)-dependent dehydrogenase (short-subunit alcohol dehydrogenase family)
MKTVFITGSGKRLGKYLAISFAKLNWNVIIHYNSSEKSAFETFNTVKSHGVQCCAVKADLKDFEQISNAFGEAVKIAGIPDVLINNAGVFPEQRNLQDIENNFWDDVINTNLRAVFYTSKIFAGIAPNNSSIVNIVSLGATEIWKKRIPYNVSKAGLLQLTKALARELAPNIKVNAVSPGTIEIPEEKPVEPIKVNALRIPMERYGTPEDVFEAVYFLSTCSNFITGQNIIVDGGFSLVK